MFWSQYGTPSLRESHRGIDTMKQAQRRELGGILPHTCAIRGGTHVGGQHLHGGYGVGLLAQTSFHFYLHPPLDLQQLLAAQLQRLQGILAGSVLVSQPVGHCRHHGCPLTTAILGTQEADVAVGHQASHRLVKTLGETAVTKMG